mgnify:CR=1 FL=1
MKDLVLSVCSKNELEILQSINYNGKIHIGAPLIKDGGVLDFDTIKSLLVTATELGFEQIIVDLPLKVDIKPNEALKYLLRLLGSGASYICIEYFPDNDELWETLSKYRSKIFIQFGYVAQLINSKHPIVTYNLDDGFVQKSTKSISYLFRGLENFIQKGYTNFLFEAISNTNLPVLFEQVEDDSFYIVTVGLRLNDSSIRKVDAVCFVLEDLLQRDDMLSIPVRAKDKSDEQVLKRVIEFIQNGKYRDLF